MNDWWEDFMPDGGDYGISPLEAAYDVVVFLAKIVGAVLFVACAVGAFAYAIWREVAIFNFLTS